ncbi:MAG: thioesterase domain-containing protein [Rhizobiaceae bacterium]
MAFQAFTTRFIAAASIAGLLAISGCSSTGTSTNAGSSGRGDPVQTASRVIDYGPKATATRTGEVYLMRGLADVFSRGMDVMAAKLNRAGVFAYSGSYSDWHEMADTIIARNKRKEVSYPVVIMGHSLGANDASKMATYLGANGVHISYVVMFDPTVPGRVGKNIDKVVNYYIPNEDNRVYKGAGFTGTLQNISMANKEDITHTTIEKNPRLQGTVISNIMSITKRMPRKKS